MVSKNWITFDLDGTLMQNPFQKWVFPEIEERINQKLKNTKDIVNLLVDKHQSLLEKGKIYEAYDWDMITAEILKDLSLERELEINVEKSVKKHSVYPKVYLLEEGIEDTLEQLRKNGFSLAVITNGFYKYQFPVLRELSIDNYFDKILTPEEMQHAKPELEIIKPLLNEGKIVAHVGDRIDHDIVMANRLNIKSILINKSLPNHYTDIPFYERKKDREIYMHCMEKWKKETKDKKFHGSYMPDIIIGSINELKKIFA